jgi:hypothetical protein
MYFKKFPQIYYDFKVGDKQETELRILTDITANVRFKKELLENISLYDEYDIQDGETPEIIADKVYGSPEYHWVIMLFNQRYNYREDFPLPQTELEEHITKTYGAGNEYDTHHYELNGFIVDSSQVGAFAVSNYEYETRENEAKRRIKLITPQLLQEILRQFDSLIV